MSNLDIKLEALTKDFESKLDLTDFKRKLEKWVSRQLEEDEDKLSSKIISSALDNVKMWEPDWTYVAARELLNKMYRDAARNRGYDEELKYGDFYELVSTLSKVQEGHTYPIYKEELIGSYTEEEIREIGSIVDPEKDKLFSYLGLHLLGSRYLATPYEGKVYELPQERFLIIAMELMRLEDRVNRVELVKEAYWALSNLYMTVATPTLSNAGRVGGQLSSCFIDVVGDSIEGIYDVNTETAKVSKSGGGVGLYVGKIRGTGSSIRDVMGKSSGTISWMQLFNQTAVSVDQMGKRQGAVALYQDVWHLDIFQFLDLKTANGDHRLKAHDIFQGVNVPDLFWERLKEVDEDGRSVGEWYLFDPHVTSAVLGFHLEDFYDETKGDGSFRKHYEIACRAADAGKLPDRTFKKIKAMDVMKAILLVQLETGTPYIWNRDTVNRANPNKHKGMIYCSNLCSEIAQNMSSTDLISEEFDTESGKIIKVSEPGDYVVCNLSSINLSKAVPANVLERLIKIQVRMLDNVIDINPLPVVQAKVTNNRYRPVGLGTFGWHHLLALEGIQWETEDAVRYSDELYEKIAFLTIKASQELAEEKGAYPYFKGSDWDTGAYFVDRGYETDEWLALRDKIKETGVRNGYMMAVAPNSSTAKIGDSTDGIDPLYSVEFIEEKKNLKINVTAPGIDHKTYEFYRKTRFSLDQLWSIRQNAARQRHVDQAISFNLYVQHTITAKDLLNLHLFAWESGLKSTYYVRSTAPGEIEECEACHS